MPSLAILLFCIAAAFLWYMLCGYPLLLFVWARLRPAQQLRHRFVRRKVTVLLPVHNGARFLRRKLDSLLALDYPRELMEIIVLSDGSTDDTGRIAEEFGARGVRLVSLPRGGKAAALNAGIAQATGEILFLTDVRQPLDRNALRALVSCFADPSVGAACGELIIRDGATREHAGIGLYWRYEKWLRRQLNRIGSLVVVTGCIFALRRSLAVPLPPGILVDDAFLPACVSLAGYRIVFEDRALAYDEPTPLETEFGRKVRTLAGLFQLVRALPRMLLPFANPLFFHFFSYKLGRLLMPYALILITVASIWMPSPWAPLLLAPQAVFYGMALANGMVPETWPVKPAFSAARAFVVLMAASFCAASVLVVPAARLWKVTGASEPTLPKNAAAC